MWSRETPDDLLVEADWHEDAGRTFLALYLRCRAAASDRWFVLSPVRPNGLAVSSSWKFWARRDTLWVGWDHHGLHVRVIRFDGRQFVKVAWDYYPEFDSWHARLMDTKEGTPLPTPDPLPAALYDAVAAARTLLLYGGAVPFPDPEPLWTTES